MIPSTKTRSFACAILALVSCSHVASAQTINTQPVYPDLIVPIYFSTLARSYVGTVTQISAAGQVTTGTFAMYVLTDGGLDGGTTLNGVSIGYSGDVSVDNATTGTAFIRAARPYTIVNGKPVYGPKTTKIPLYLTAKSVYGGSLDKDGNGLLFRAELGAYPYPIVIPAGSAGN